MLLIVFSDQPWALPEIGHREMLGPMKIESIEGKSVPTHPSEPPAMKRPHDMIGPVQTKGIYFPVCDIKYSVKFYSVQMTQIMCISS